MSQDHQHDPRIGVAGSDGVGDRGTGLLAETTLEDERRVAECGELGDDRFDVLGPLGQYQAGPTGCARCVDVTADLGRTVLVFADDVVFFSNKAISKVGSWARLP